MRWQGRRKSSNINDRRGIGGKGLAIGGGIGTVVIAVIVLLLGGDPGQILNMDVGGGGGQSNSAEYVASPEEEKKAEFVAVVLADTEDAWNRIFADMGRQYAEPTLTLFTGSVRSACGSASSATGPFYCPGDQQVYIDLSFYDELSKRFNAPGDFAMAYVVAHEVGHHVQNLLGYSDRLQQARGRVSEKEFNELSVKLELQADFLAGVWAHHTQQMKNVLEEGDIEEAMNAANAIGDDRLQRQSQGRVVPDSFTHGTSEQRMRWFMKGYKSGDIREGDTFSARSL